MCSVTLKYLVFSTHEPLQKWLVSFLDLTRVLPSVPSGGELTLLLLASCTLSPSWTQQLPMHPTLIKAQPTFRTYRQKHWRHLSFPDLISWSENIPSGYSLQILKDRILTSKENADSRMTKLKVTGKTKHLFRSYSVCFYRAMLPRIIDSGRSVNAYSTIHIWVCSHGRLLETLPVAPELAVFTGVCSLCAPGLCVPRELLMHSERESSLGQLLSGPLQPPGPGQRFWAASSVWVLASPCSSFLVCSWYVVASLFNLSYLHG